MKFFLICLVLLLMSLPTKLQASIKLSVISKIESSNNPKAYNKKGNAYGLFQITPICLKHFNAVHRTKYTVQDLFDGHINSLIAAWYIQYLSKHFHSDREVLVAYNAGFKRAKAWNGNVDNLPTETKSYLQKYHKLVR